MTKMQCPTTDSLHDEEPTPPCEVVALTMFLNWMGYMIKNLNDMKNYNNETEENTIKVAFILVFVISIIAEIIIEELSNLL